MENCERVTDIAQRMDKGASGQSGLFDKDSIPEDRIEITAASEWNSQELLSYEKETLGFYITSHPLSRFLEKLEGVVTADSETILSVNDGENVAIAGIVSAIRETLTKKKETMAYVTLEDMKGSVQVIVFSELFRNASQLLKADDPLIVRGRADIGEDSVKIVASEIIPLDVAVGNLYGSVHIFIDLSVNLDSVLESIKDLLVQHKGKSESYLHLINPNHSDTIIRLGEDFKVDFTPELSTEIEDLTGKGSVYLK